jgi:hypothetical protein
MPPPPPHKSVVYKSSPSFSWGKPHTPTRPSTAPSTSGSSPGPTSYTLPSTLTPIRTPSFGPRPSVFPASSRGETGPGPGAYRAEYNKQRGPSFSIGGRRGEGRREATPGPNAYSVSPSGMRAGGVSLGGKWKRDRFSDTPGPGAYEYRQGSIGGEAGRKGASIAGRTGPARELASDGPGPGAYSVPTTLAKSGVSLSGKRKEPHEASATGPGPGAYNVGLISDSDAPKYSMAGRRKEVEADTGPGPGAFNIGTTVGVDAPRVSIKGKTWMPQGQDQASLPGPNQYSLPSDTSGPAFTLRPKIAEPRRDTGPGPASYRPAHAGAFAYDVIGGMISAPVGGALHPSRDRAGDLVDFAVLAHDDWGLSARKGPTLSGKWKDRPQSAGASGPGPGSYSPERLDRPPAISLKGKEKKKTADTGPGPAAYSPAAGRKGPDTRPAPTISGWAKVTDFSSGSPGPGAYKVEGLIGT